MPPWVPVCRAVGGDQDDGHGPGDALRVLGSRRERAECAVHHRVEGVTEHEPHDDPGDHRGSGGRNVDGIDQADGGECDQGGQDDLRQAEQSDARDLAGQQVARAAKLGTFAPAWRPIDRTDQIDIMSQ